MGSVQFAALGAIEGEVRVVGNRGLYQCADLLLLAHNQEGVLLEFFDDDLVAVAVDHHGGLEQSRGRRHGGYRNCCKLSVGRRRIAMALFKHQ